MAAKIPCAETLWFSIHGIGVEYQAATAQMAEPALRLLGIFRRDRPENSAPLTIQFEEVESRREIPVTVPSGGRLISSVSGTAIREGTRHAWECRVVEDESRLVADFDGDGCIVIDRVFGVARGYLVRSGEMPSQTIEWYLHFALGELLKLRGLYTIHATALERHGRGVLIPGYSGRGKTTSFLSLLRAGYRYLSDDTPWIRLNAGQVEILPFPMKVDVTDQTIAFFPELRDAPQGLLHQGVHKKYFNVEDVYPHGMGECCRPGIILFPQVVEAPKSRLEPMPKSHALKSILPQTMVVHDPELARRQFQVLTKLVQRADCYTLHFGQDVLALPELVDSALQQLPAA